jgi:hypothetical protein
MQQAGIEFGFGIPGYGMVWLKPAHIPELLHDREAFTARCVGVSLQDYRRWQESEGRVWCAAITRKGRRCKFVVAHSLPPQEWLASQGSYCTLHGGERP